MSSGRWEAASGTPLVKEEAPAKRTVSSGRWEAASGGALGSQSGLRAAASSESRLAALRGSSGRTTPAVRILTGEAPAEPVVVSIAARSHDDVLEYTHAFVVSYARGRFRASIVQALSVASYELLGNALNYGSVLGEIVFELIEATESVAVRVSNDAVKVRIDMLCSHLDRVNANPEAVFVEEMGRSVTGGSSKPMLGLVRIVHEARLSLEVYVRGTRLTTLARIAT